MPNTTTSQYDDQAALFSNLQATLPELYRTVFATTLAPRTIVVVPSLSLDQEVLARIPGVTHYEERMLCFLLLLRYPNAHVIYVTSRPISPEIIDYYLNLLSGVPRNHAYRRLTLLSCHDGSDRPLTAKILERPRLIAKIRRAIASPGAAHMTCFSVSDLERRLAVDLGVPIYGCDPALQRLGSKSGSRAVFHEAGVPTPDGVEDLADAAQIAAALADLKRRDPSLKRAVVKLNEGFSGEGNALFDYAAAPDTANLEAWIADQLPKMRFVAADMTWEQFEEKFTQMQGIVEAFVAGAVKRSPSAQLRIDPLGGLETISTHDQLTGGDEGQIFEGCRFPADASYRMAIQTEAEKIGVALKDKGVLGRFGVDFISVKEKDLWRHYALEINLRKGGTTHPFTTLQFLTEGRYDPQTGRFYSSDGRERFYYASDNLQASQYRGLAPDDLIEIAVENGLHFHTVRQEGVVFHIIGALSEFGKLGVVCVAGSPDTAAQLYRDTVAVLDRACGAAPAIAANGG